jgi:hypothetical protein
MNDDRDPENLELNSDPPDHDGGGSEAAVAAEEVAASDPPDHDGGGTA